MSRHIKVKLAPRLKQSEDIESPKSSKKGGGHSKKRKHSGGKKGQKDETPVHNDAAMAILTSEEYLPALSPTASLNDIPPIDSPFYASKPGSLEQLPKVNVEPVKAIPKKPNKMPHIPPPKPVLNSEKLGNKNNPTVPFAPGVDYFKVWQPKIVKGYGYFSLFRFASCLDRIFMFVGILAAIGSGICIPLVIYKFGNFIRAQALVEKMAKAYKCVKGSNLDAKENCQLFLNECDLLALEPEKNYLDKRFATRPEPNFEKMTFDHISTFLDEELLLTTIYTVLCSTYFFCWNFASHNQAGKIRRALFLNLLQRDMSWFDVQTDPDAVNRMMENTRRIEDGISESIPVAISLSVMFVFCCGLSFYHGLELSLVGLVAIPLLMTTTYAVSSAKATRILTERRYYHVAHEMAKEVLSKMKTIIICGVQSGEKALYKKEIYRGNRLVTTLIFCQAAAVSLLFLVNFTFWAVIIWYGSTLVLFHHKNCSDKIGSWYDAGDVVVIIFCMVFGCGNAYMVVTVVKAMHVAKFCGKEVFRVIDGPHGITGMHSVGNAPREAPAGRVEFIDVRFTYPGRKRDVVLNHLNLVAEPHSTVAIVGVTQSGKSTILKLICKEYIPDSGFIKIDGKDIRTLKTEWLRSHISYISQEITLFNMSIEENVRMGKLDATFFEVQDACKKAGAHDFIVTFKEGYQTKLGVHGAILTPCQKQQLAMARALVRDPKILLLDEPTAHQIDSQSMSIFMQNLFKISKERTVIIVAHQLATITHANMIYVMRRGHVVERGDHQSLLRSNGAYSQLCSSNKPSHSIKKPPKLDAFDTSEMSIISCMKTFNPRPMLPNFFNDMLSVDPVVNKVTDAILKDYGEGFQGELRWTLVDQKPIALYHERRDEELFGVNNNPENGEEIPYNLPGLNPTLSTIKVELDKASSLGRVIEKQGEYEKLSILSSSGESWFRVLLMSLSSPVLTAIGMIATIFLGMGIPFFGLMFSQAITILPGTSLKALNWFHATHLGGELYHILVVGSIWILGAYLGFFSFIQEFCINMAAFRSVQKLRDITYSYIMKQDMSFFDDPQNSSMYLASILLQDTDSIRHVTVGVFSTLVQSVTVFSVVVGICLYHTISLTGYTLLIVFCVVGLNILDGWFAKRQHAQTIKLLEDVSNLILEVFRRKHLITVCQMEPHFAQEFTRVQRKSLQLKKQLACVRLFTHGLSQSAVFWAFGVFLRLGAYKMQNGGVTFFDVLTNGFVLIFGLITLGTNLSVMMGFKHVRKAGARILDIVDRKPIMSSSDGHRITKEQCQTMIEFVHTKFWKPHAQDITLLNEVNLEIPPGMFTTIVGSPESGKSGFLEILAKYYDPTGGTVTIAGEKIQHFNPESFRQHVSVVPRKPELFTRTVAQNISIGDNTHLASMSEIIAAAKKASVHSFIVSLPEGYETRLGGEHDYLSTAQKHKLALARALFKDPAILIIDDIFSLLDTEGERTVMESIEEAKKGRTVIFISHRILDGVQHADKIAVMQNGCLEEIGGHDDLLRRKDGLYARLWKAQNPLEDDNFLSGKVTMTVQPVKKRKSHNENLTPVTPVYTSPMASLSPASKQDFLPYRPEEKGGADDGVAPSGFCGNYFGFLGFGAVENEDDDDEDFY